MQRQRPGSATQLRRKAALGPWYSRAILGVVLPLGIGVGIAQSQGRWEPRHTVPQQTIGQQRMIRVAQAGESHFNIPSQPLSSALRQFSQVANLELFFDAVLTEGLHTQGLSGTYAPEPALQRLLAGTGLRYQFTSPNAVTLERQVAQESGTAREAQQLAPIVVREEREATGYKVEQTTSATKTDTPLLDIPQSIEIIPREVIEDQGAVEVRDVLRNVSGITATNSSFTGFADQINIRGFDASDNFVKNGLRRGNFGESLPQETANIERLEVLKGPASVLYGQLDPGGAVNIVTKQPLDTPLYAADLTLGSYEFFRPTLDLSGPVNTSNTVLYRLNMAYERSEAFLDFFESEHFFASPVVTVRFTPRTTLTLEGEYLQRNFSFYPGLPAVGTVLSNINGDIPLHRWTGDPPFDDTKRIAGEVGYRFEHRFNRHVLVRNAFRAIFFRRDEQNILPLALEDDQRTLARALFEARRENNDYLMQTELVADFTTGPVAHTVLVGFDLRRIDEDNETRFDESFPSLDLFNPTYFNTFSSSLPFNRFDFQDDRVGVYVQDQVTLLPNLKLLAGVRFDYAHQDTRRTDGETGERTPESRDDTAFSPRVGIVYQPIMPLALYANFSESFEPQPGNTGGGTPFEPETGTQYEIGVKGEFLDRRIAVLLAFYHITKQNVESVDPDNPEFTRAIGEQRNRGIELDVAGELLPGWRVIASYAYTDAEVTEDFGGFEGLRPPNVALHGFSLWSTYEFQQGALQGLGFGAGIFYVGERYGDFENTFELPDYVRTDMSVFYQPRFLPNLRARLTVQNLFDVEYFESADETDVTVHPGSPITVLGTVAVRF
jgi:iron complex outermembrane recepter protein